MKEGVFTLRYWQTKRKT